MSTRLARFHQLDTLRFLFAMIIVTGHLVGFDVSFPMGALAVDFFFLLSGFVLAHMLINRPMDFTSFTVSRFARMYPLHIVTLFAITLIYMLTGDGLRPEGDGPKMLALNLAMAHSILPGSWLSFNGASWSISTEFYANILVLYAVCRFRAWRFSLIAAVLLYAALVAGFGPFHELHTQSFGPTTAGFVRCVAGVLLGYVLYEAYRRFHRENKPISRESYIIVSALQIGIITSIFEILLMQNSLQGSLTLFCLSVILILAFSLRRGIISDAFAWPGISWLGALSYGVYLWHTPLIHLFDRLGFNITNMNSPIEGNMLILIGFYAALMLISGASYVLLEKPAKRHINAFWRRHQARRAALD